MGSGTAGQQYSDMATHFPPEFTQIQSAPAGTYPRVAVFENSGSLYTRLSTGQDTYLEFQINADRASANKVVNGEAQIVTLAVFDQ